MSARSAAHAELGRRIGAARLRLDVTQQEAAGVAGINAANFAKIERGDGNPSFDTLVRIATALDLDPGELLTGLHADDLPEGPATYSVREFREEKSRRLAYGRGRPAQRATP